MTMIGALHVLIAAGRTEGLAAKAARLCELGLITEADRNAVASAIGGSGPEGSPSA